MGARLQKYKFILFRFLDLRWGVYNKRGIGGEGDISESQLMRQTLANVSRCHSLMRI